VNQGMDEDLVDYKQGSCSARAVLANTDRFYITDANLDSGFPLKSGESNKTFSIAFWFYLESVGIGQWFPSKYASGNFSFIVQILTSNKLNFQWSSNGSSADSSKTHDSTLSINTWYHVACTYDESDDSFRIRIWDDTAEEILGTDLTGTGGDIYIGTALFRVGTGSSSSPDGNIDELVVFDRVLSVADIDAVRAGTYGSGALTANVVDSITIAESLASLLPKLIKSISDSVAIADVVGRKLSISIGLSDSVVIVESITGDWQEGLLEVTIYDSVSLAESLVALLPKLYKSLSDSLTVNEVIQILLPQLFKSVNDSLTVIDVLSASYTTVVLLVNLSDSVVVVDSVIRGPSPAGIGPRAIPFVSQIHTNINLDSILPVPLVT